MTAIVNTDNTAVKLCCWSPRLRTREGVACRKNNPLAGWNLALELTTGLDWDRVVLPVTCSGRSPGVRGVFNPTWRDQVSVYTCGFYSWYRWVTNSVCWLSEAWESETLWCVAFVGRIGLPRSGCSTKSPVWSATWSNQEDVAFVKLV